MTLQETQMLDYLSLFGLAAVTGLGIGGPGDAALAAAAVLASQGQADLTAVLIVAYLGSVLGRVIGFGVGRRRDGSSLMERPGRFQKYRLRILKKGDLLFEKHPKVAPFVVPPPVSGLHKVSWPFFFLASLVGALGWTLGTGLVAYFLGEAGVRYLQSIGGKGIAAVIVVAAIALLYRYLWQRREPKETDRSTPPTPESP
jgi:membrane protein DedA with SNARE-associated domain